MNKILSGTELSIKQGWHIEGTQTSRIIILSDKKEEVRDIVFPDFDELFKYLRLNYTDIE